MDIDNFKEYLQRQTTDSLRVDFALARAAYRSSQAGEAREAAGAEMKAVLDEAESRGRRIAEEAWTCRKCCLSNTIWHVECQWCGAGF